MADPSTNGKLPAPGATPEAQFESFPVAALPEPLAGFVAAGAKAIGCDSSYIALPLLTAVAGAIGNSRRLQLKQGWSAPAILWAAVVGESGTHKTPAFKLAMKAIRERQSKALERHADAIRQHDADLARWDRDLAEWKRGNSTGDPPKKPDEPQAERCIVSDTTVEALAPILLENPRGLLLARDELSGWIGSFDRYAKGKGGGDSAHWLSMHSGEAIINDRKTGIPRTIFVPQASVSICGGIQPGILKRALGSEHLESGLAARLLLTCPPRKAKRWTEAGIDPEAEAEIARLVERLYELQPTIGKDGELLPVLIRLAPQAKAAFKSYYDQHAQEQAALEGELSAAWSKLEEYAARLALVVHCARWAADDSTLASADVVDLGSMEAGISLANWFKGEAKRVYAMLAESDGVSEERRLIEWLEKKGGSATAREAQQGCRWLRGTGAAEDALMALAAGGIGTWEPAESGARGKATRRFRLHGVNGNRENTGKEANTVDVDTVDTVPDDDWGVV